MSLPQQIKELREKRKGVLDQAGAILTKASKEKRDLTGEENTEFEARHADGTKFKEQIDRLVKQHEAETELAAAPEGDKRSAGKEDFDGREQRDATKREGETADAPKRDDKAEMRTFRKWMSEGPSGLDREERQSLAALDLPPEVRALSASTGSAGAYTIPQGFQNTLDEALLQYGGIFAVADYIDTTEGNVLPYPTENDTGNQGEGPLGENTGAATNQDPAFGVVNFNAYMYDSAIVKIPIQLLQDSAFNMDAFLTRVIPVRIGRKTSAHFTTGTGSSQPTGIITAATLGKSAASATAITYLELLDLLHSVDPAYRVPAQGAGWMFKDSTLLAIRKLVDSNSRPLFVAGGTAEGIQNANPDTLAGFPFAINQDMASIATTAKTVVFGALKKFKIRRVRQMQMVRFAERFMDSLQIGFLAFQRFDSNLIDAGTHPVKYLQQA